MLLGALMSELKSPDSAGALLDRIGDAPLLARLQEMAGRHGEETGEYASATVARFSRDAGDEQWLTLIATIERADDPAEASLRFMIEWALKADEQQRDDGCACGSGNSCCGEA